MCGKVKGVAKINDILIGEMERNIHSMTGVLC